MFDYLEKLRQRPEPARRRMLLMLSGGLTLVIFFLWLLNLKYAGPLIRSTESEEVKAAGAVARIKAGWQVLRGHLPN